MVVGLGVAVVVLALGIATVVAYLMASDRSAADSARAQAVPAATRLTEGLLTYDYRSIDQQIAAIDGAATGPFGDQFRTVMQQTVKPNAVQQQATTTAKSRSGGVITAEPDKVVVLLFLDQTTTANTLPGPRIDTVQARVTLQRVDGQWRVSGLDQI